MTSRSPQDRFVDYLERLANEAHRDRASLAALRSGLRADRQWQALRIVLPYVHGGLRREDDALLLAGLFALHPESGRTSLAAALRKIAESRGSESIEGRFTALLAADRDDLDHHLRHAVTLVRTMSPAPSIDWRRLHRDIRYWDDDRTRRRWAREYWGMPDAALEPDDAAASMEVAGSLSSDSPSTPIHE